MKYAVLIGDGMSDLPLEALGGKTPLEIAKTPNMDEIAATGACGLVCNVPAGMTPGSDVAAMSILGYDPARYYSGRGPLEAASLGITLKKNEVAFRCNFVYVKNKKMFDFTAGHISTDEAAGLITLLNKSFSPYKFHLGLSYRHIMVMGEAALNAECVPPHDITGKEIGTYLPKGPGAQVLKELMEKSVGLLKEAKPDAMIWLWGQGKTPDLPSFEKRFKKKGSVITAVHLIKGLGKILGLEVIDVPGATGFVDTNYRGKAEYALKSLEDKDVVFVHVEAPDEAGHMGKTDLKIKAIEDFDREVVGRILEGIKKFGDYRILVLPDHPTPISIMSHTADPVPYAFCGSGIKTDEIKDFTENAISQSKVLKPKGFELLGEFLS